MSVSAVVSASQKSIASHRKLCNRLFLLKDENDFLPDLLGCLNALIRIKRGNPNAERVLRFIITFINYLQQKIPDYDLAQPILKHLLKGVDAKDKVVRYRCCQAIARVTNMLREIDDELYGTLRSKLLLRVRDKESTVRVEAAIALSRLQDQDETDENEVRDTLLFLLQSDPSVDVRRAVLLNVEVSNKTLPFILERARDVDPKNRRIVYAKVLPKIGDFRYLNIRKRIRILKWGLKDRDETVQLAAAQMLSTSWISNANNNLLELLERLDVVNNEEIAVLVLENFFKLRPEIFKDLQFEESFWKELTAESSILARVFNSICVQQNLTELNERIPDLVQLTFFLEQQYVRMRNETVYEEVCFVIQQLLHICNNMNLGDEIGRRKLLGCLSNSLTTLELPDQIVKLQIELMVKLCTSELDFCSLMMEVITDVYEQGHETPQQEQVEPNKSSPSELDTDSDARSSLSAAETQSPDVIPEVPAANAEEKLATQLNEKDIKAAFSELHCLTYIQFMFENITSDFNKNHFLPTILQSIIIPSVRSHDAPIREKGLKCLGLSCLLHRELAKENITLYLHCFTNGDTSLQLISIHVICDIILMFGPSIAEDHEQEISDMYLTALSDLENQELQANAAEAISKFLMIVHFHDDLFIKPLIIQYFEPNTFENQRLRQVLGYFFPVYAFGSYENQRRIGNVFCDTLLHLMEIYDSLDDDDRVLTPLNIAQQILDWIDFEKLYMLHDNLKLENQDLHLHIADNIIDALVELEDDESKDKKLLISLLGKLKIPRTLPSQSYAHTISKLETFEQHGILLDTSSSNMLNKFAEAMEYNKQIAQKNEEETVHVVSDTEEDTSMIDVKREP
ncbi:condensin complex non-SMC subunit Cnd3 [Schizosaccharomyces japonicus yFS275]|uniref:Condensin complex non-SMC subunit Cnd3 n=1 Tax=Schizosaccharomyces japonicus (strain yFS275 / FY16936) TaxID=402676 RepID=B6K4W8_SCHJY|nr:condensin complex non-SMC subunit Cnd3 [Schizosaccharomyces japonicus yFS275]EEB08525.1 condensin complex non-SMC subunit Cnd3 [Schizosaccharomyces japonicus yFS275]